MFWCYYLHMNNNNLSNYISALEMALAHARNMLNGELNLDGIFKDLDKCNSSANLIFSNEKFMYEDSKGVEVEEEVPCILSVEPFEYGYRFVLDRLLPHRLDYHKLGSSLAKKINHYYAMNFQKGVFRFLLKNEVVMMEEKAMLIFINYYNPEEKLTWDNDNLDVKVFIDYAISGKFINDDGHEELSYMMLSKEGSTTHTEVILCKEVDCSEVLASFKEA